MTKILVTGATGTIGSQVVRELLEQGADVRAAVRSPDKAAWMRKLGAEVVRFDFTDAASVDAAFSGVSRALLVSLYTPGDHTAIERVIAAAQAAGTQHIARISALGADPDAPLGIAEWHGREDQTLADSGIGYTIIKPTFFQDNLLKFHADTLRSAGQFYGSSGDGRTAYVSSADIAEVVAAVLLSPTAHAGQSYVLTGPEPLADTEVAAILSETIDKPVQYVDLPREQLGAGMAGSGVPQFMVDALLGLEDVKRQGWAAEVSPVVAELLGRPPETMGAYLARNAGAFSAPAA